MRVTVSHNKGLAGVTKIVNDSADQLLATPAAGPVTFSDMEKRWEGSTMYFSFRARMGVFNSALKGYVQCSERDVTVELELPNALKAFVPEEKMKAQMEGKVRGLLNA
jgi:hypothetical protein